MRRVVQHTAGAIAIATLMALLIPASPQALENYPIVAATAASNATVAAKSGATAATDGRWKLGGDGSCYWDPDDSGPNQCTPPAADGIEATDGTAGVSAQLRAAEFHSRI